MRPRDLLILGIALAFGSAGLVLLGGETQALTLPTPAPEAPAAPDAIDAVAHPGEGGGAEDAMAPIVAAAAATETRTDTTGWDKGIIRGDIGLSVAILNQIESIQVQVKELRNSTGSGDHPFAITVPVQRGIGTPTFEVRDVPFSTYPYAVIIYSPGLNGGRSTVNVDKDHAFVDVSGLTITGGAPYTVLLRDQDANPYPMVDVRMIPVGEPPNRRDYHGSTDSFGSIVFENVLRGDYRLVASSQGMPLCDPVVATVEPGTRNFGSKIQGQGYTLMAPRGVKVGFSIGDANGYGVENAMVKLTLTDRVRPKELTLATDHAGLAEFPHVLPGTYIVNVLCDGYQPSFRQITLKDTDTPALQQFRLVRAL